MVGGKQSQYISTILYNQVQAVFLIFLIETNMQANPTFSETSFSNLLIGRFSISTNNLESISSLDLSLHLSYIDLWKSYLSFLYKPILLISKIIFKLKPRFLSC